ncbi:KH domain-containing protein [Lactiplantibacillus garii]|uniref:RNA-binding protein KhpB n=1 Tax=Lactiplantibacillus garii TaxID=2306423 RepID=A0A426D7F1_9LACO|nr:RNA-binding cell elongation regulator Jag/EloR [Lactiplantibacillus garii]RRK10524.1 KH domain-containing protein [Lactiplantibacillus garii]
MTVFEGNTVEAAIAAGLKQMQRTRDQVTIEVVAEPKKGFLGLGKQPAQVRLTAVPTSAASTTMPTSAPSPTPQSASTPAPSAASQAPASAQPVQPVVTPKVTVTAPKKAQPAKVTPATVQTQTPVKSEKPAQPATPVRSPEEIAARQAANEQAVRDLSAYLLEVVKELGITADLDVDFGNRYATLNFDTAKQGLLIGKHGRTINALQDLAQVYMNHHGASHVNVVLDVDDYRDRREATLKRLAESTAREAIATGKQVFLDPMPSFERKLIHAELANNRHVTTFSEGRDPHRAVVVAIRK